MSRPCVKDHSLQPEACRLCFWCVDRSAKGKQYRQLWNEPEPSEDTKVPNLTEKQVPLKTYASNKSPCKHLGDKTNEVGRCIACGTKERTVDIYNCSLFGSCTKLLNVKKDGIDINCCRNCSSYEDSNQCV